MTRTMTSHSDTVPHLGNGSRKATHWSSFVDEGLVQQVVDEKYGLVLSPATGCRASSCLFFVGVRLCRAWALSVRYMVDYTKEEVGRYVVRSSCCTLNGHSLTGTQLKQETTSRVVKSLDETEKETFSSGSDDLQLMD